MAYDLEPVKAPRAAGGLLKFLVHLVENPVIGALLSKKLLAQTGVVAMRDTQADEEPFRHHELYENTAAINDKNETLTDILEIAFQQPKEGFHFPEAADYVSAYNQGRTDPLTIARRFIDLARQSDDEAPGMGFFIARDSEDLLKQARASAKRYQDGKPLSPLDGVPIAVKDEIDQTPYPTTVGTGFLGRSPVKEDATVVARLRAAGALLVGKTNMHEIGIGVTGINPNWGPARNPYDPERITGGSSSGTAAVVASGLCPIAVGADGGGSIRIPAAFCGVNGLKPTFGRVSEKGAAPLCWSLAHLGPIASSIRDLALTYSIIAGPDTRDPNSLLQPMPDMAGLKAKDLSGIRLGIYKPYFEDADPKVVSKCYEVVDILKQNGAIIEEIEIPELSVLRSVHLVTIVSEMAGAHIGYYADHKKDYGYETRMSLALGRRLGGYDYVHAQRLRSRVSGYFFNILKRVHGIITPTIGMTAPKIPTDAIKTGESNLGLTTSIMRFATAANLTGLPAITFPAGYDDAGMPIGFQVMGRAWKEDLLLRIAFAVQAQMTKQRPKRFFNTLG